MRCSSGIASSSSILVSIRTAFERASETIREPIDFAILFLSGEGLSEKEFEIESFWDDLAPGIPLFGCSAESLVGQKTELEGQCAATVLLLSGLKELPKLYELECIQTPDGPSVMGVTDELIAESSRGLFVVACPVSFSVELLADVLDYENSMTGGRPSSLIGGYCSSQNWQAPNVLFAGKKFLRQGAVAMTLPRGLVWHTIISQGCRPVGDPYVITAMEGQTVVELGGRPAMQRLRELYATMPVNEQHMMSNSLMMGRAISEYSETFAHGEFLIRAVQGIDSSNQGLVVTDRFQVGQTVRFHVRDADAADADMNRLLSLARDAVNHPCAAVLVSCNGRGTRMFPTHSHDAKAVHAYFPEIPLAGFFAAGEFGPVADQNLVHGFTAVVHLLVEQDITGQ